MGEGQGEVCGEPQAAGNLCGIPIKTVYTREDVEGLDLDTLPGVYPFTRGLYPDGLCTDPLDAADALRLRDL